MAWLRGGECIYSGEASGGRMALAPLDTASVAALAGRVTHYLLAGVPAKASFFSAGFSKLRTRPSLAHRIACVGVAPRQGKLTGDSPREPQGQAGRSQKRGKENAEKVTTMPAGGHPVSELRVIATDIERPWGFWHSTARWKRCKPLQTPASQGPGSAGRGENVRITGTNWLLTRNPPRLSPWRRLFGGGPVRGRAVSAERQTRREIEKSQFTGVSIGFCPRTGVGMVLFSGTQSINELPLFRTITC